MATVELDPTDESRVVVESSLNEIHLVTQIPGVLHDSRRSRPGVNLHTAPRTWATWMALQGIFTDYPPGIGPGYSGWLNEDWTNRVEPCLGLRLSTDVLSDPNTDWDKALYPFQRAGVAFLALAGRALLGDEMGAGKTPQTICAIRRLHDYGRDVFPVCCIVPNTTKGQWRREWERWFPGVKISVVSGGLQERRKALAVEADVYVIHWDVVMLHSRVWGWGNVRLRRCARCDRKTGDPNLSESRCEMHRKELNKLPIRTVVVDEAHLMKNAQAKRTRAVWAVQKGDHVQYAFSLTGTPIGDTPGDLWPIMHGLHDLEYPTNTSYVQRYCYQTWNWDGDLVIVGINPNTRTEFFGFFDSRFRRMPKALVLPQLPPVVHETRECPMSTKQAKAYREMVKHQMAEMNDGARLLTAPNNLARDTRLLQFASATCELTEQDEVVMRLPSPKIDALLEVLEEAGGRFVVACAESRKLIELTSSVLEREKIRHEVLVGGMTSDQRDAVLQQFEAGELPVLLFTMKTGGTGINLTRASVMVRMDRSWSMLTNYQTVNRFHRIGSEMHSSLTLVDLVVPGTKEDTQFQRLGEKMGRLEEITRDKVTLAQTGQWSEITVLEREEQQILSSSLL